MSNALKEKPKAEPQPMLASAGVILNDRYLPPPEDKDGKLWIRTSRVIQTDPQTLYQMWRDVEKAPLWQEQIAQVTRTSETKSHWVMRPADQGDGKNRGKDHGKDKDKDKGKEKTIEWDSEILADEPGHRIAWRSVCGDSENAGEVIFEPFM